jgi:hypothetical protein
MARRDRPPGRFQCEAATASPSPLRLPAETAPAASRASTRPADAARADRGEARGHRAERSLRVALGELPTCAAGHAPNFYHRARPRIHPICSRKTAHRAAAPAGGARRARRSSPACAAPPLTAPPDADLASRAAGAGRLAAPAGRRASARLHRLQYAHSLPATSRVVADRLYAPAPRAHPCAHPPFASDDAALRHLSVPLSTQPFRSPFPALRLQ